MWEDEANQNGGRWTLRVSKGYANKLWEDLILAMIGEQFSLENEINGIVLSIRGQGDQISIWNRNGNNKEIVEKIKQELVSILQLPENIKMDYNMFNQPADSKSKATSQSTRELQPARDYKPRGDAQGSGMSQHDIGNKSSYRDDGHRRGGYRGGHEGGYGRGGYYEGSKGGYNKSRGGQYPPRGGRGGYQGDGGNYQADK